MKQVVQNYKTGELKVEEAPTPALRPWGLLVENAYSLVSAGTERSKVELAHSNLLAKARQRPDQVKRVLDNVKQEGIIATYQKVMTRLDTPITLGYCSAGTVIQVSPRVQEFQAGDRVACAGEGYGCHAEMVYVPRNLCAKVPDNVTLDQAAFAPLGAIGLQGLRLAQAGVGENVAVIGLGLVGLLTVQLLKAAGCRVAGIDVDTDKVGLARALGADISLCRSDPNLEESVNAFCQGRGFDAVLITASTKSTDPVTLAGALCREKGRVIVVGAVPVDVPRKDYYEKELELCISRSFGPGTYDEDLVRGGVDYPYAYVRWTAQRNMEAFLGLLAQERVDLGPLITHRFPIDEAPRAYELLRQPKGRVLGILFEYGTAIVPAARPAARVWVSEDAGRPPAAGRPRIALGFLGAGNFAQSYLLPHFRQQDGLVLRGVATATSVSASNAARKYGFAYCTCDYNQVLDDPEIDCVVISTRHDLHARLAAEALRKNKTVYVEKPLALSEEELRQVIEAYQGASQGLMVGFNRRFSPLVRRAKDFLSNRTGPLVMNYRINAGPLPADYWLHDPVEGGGRILGEVCHFVDLLQYLAGSPPVRVYAQEAAGNKATPDRENVSVNIDFEDGSIGSITYSALGTLSFPRERVEIMGNGSVVVIDNFKWASFTRARRTRKARRWWGRDMGYRDEVVSFADALKSGGAMPISFKEIVAATLATFKVLGSIQTGLPREVDLAEWLSAG